MPKQSDSAYPRVEGTEQKGASRFDETWRNLTNVDPTKNMEASKFGFDATQWSKTFKSFFRELILTKIEEKAKAYY